MICGFGEVGSTVARVAVEHGRHAHRIIVVEHDAVRARRAAACGYRTIVADATSANSLRPASAALVATVIICVADADAPEAVRAARRAAPGASIQVVLDQREQADATAEAGADVVLLLPQLAGKLLAAAALVPPNEGSSSESG